MAESADLLELMALHEEKIMELYLVYADKFYQMEKFWKELAYQEQEHAEVVRAVTAKVKSGEAVVKQGRIKAELVKSMLSYMDKEIAKAQSLGIEPVNALASAVDLEKSMVERKLFDIVESDPEALKEAFERIGSSTQAHLLTLQSELQKEKSK